MHRAIPHLVELQLVDQQIAGLRADLESLPKRTKQSHLDLSAAEARAASAREALARVVAERKKLEFESQQWKDRARKFRDQSSAVKTNEAFRALQHEIANADAEMTKAEDRQLEVMMSVEQAELGVKAAEIRLREEHQEIAAQRKAVESEAAEKKKMLEAKLVLRETVLAPIPDDMRDLYLRIGKRHNGMALAEARENQCRGCGMRVLPHILQELRTESTEELYRCEGCGLILYSLDPVPVAPAKPAPGSSSSASGAS